MQKLEKLTSFHVLGHLTALFFSLLLIGRWVSVLFVNAISVSLVQCFICLSGHEEVRNLIRSCRKVFETARYFGRKQ
jgi:hypothetical protein